MLYNFGSFRRSRMLFLFLFFIFPNVGIFGQVTENFVSTPEITYDSVDSLLIIKHRDADIAAIPASLPKNVRTFLKNKYNSKAEYLLGSIKDGEFLIGSTEEAYIRNIVKNIQNANPQVMKDLVVFVSRNPQPNAFNTGDGTVVFEIGLLRRVNNEAQLAFILCHEISHQCLSHVNKSLETFATKYLDKDFQRSLKHTLKEEYSVNQKLTDLLLPGILSDMRYSRHDESQADSLGLILLSRTAYDPGQALTSMDVLDGLDQEPWKEEINLRAFFTIPEVPVRNSWFKYEGASSLGEFESEKDSLEDSLKTHPDCKLRKADLERQLTKGKYPPGKLFVQPEDTFDIMKMRTQGEIIHTYYYYFGNYGRAMYLSLHMLEDYPKNQYPRSVLSKCLALYSRSQKNREAGKIISLPSPDYTENYNRFLTFLSELKVNESADFSYYMVRPEKADLEKYDEYLAALTYSSFVTKNEIEFKKYKEEYLKRFPKGLSSQTIKELEPTNTPKKK